MSNSALFASLTVCILTAFMAGLATGLTLGGHQTAGVVLSSISLAAALINVTATHLAFRKEKHP